VPVEEGKVEGGAEDVCPNRRSDGEQGPVEASHEEASREHSGVRLRVTRARGEVVPTLVLTGAQLLFLELKDAVLELILLWLFLEIFRKSDDELHDDP
jgi:hypothetical protein